MYSSSFEVRDFLSLASMSTQKLSTQKSVVITGMGLVSPLGCDLDEVWDALQAGRSGISKIESMDCSSLPFSAGGEAKSFTGKIDDYGELDKKLARPIKKNMKVMCREIEMGVAASQRALAHSGLGDDRDPTRCGCIFGCDYILTQPDEYMAGLHNCRNEAGGQFEIGDWPVHGLPKVNPLWLLKYLPNMPNSHVSIYNDFRGPNNSITDREASMNLSILEATSIIQRGAADVMLVGATGTRLHPLRTQQTYLSDEVAPDCDPPSKMSRPFDQSSQGSALGEGAGTIMLESAEHAAARGARIWGEVLSGASVMIGKSAGKQYLSQAVATAMTKALDDQKLPEQWHVHAQGMGSPKSDQAEAIALNEVLAERSAPVAAAKSFFGNLGAGSAAIELIASLLAMENGKLFPLLNLAQPIEGIIWQPSTADSAAGNAVLHTSFTQQGQACSVLIGKA